MEYKLITENRFDDVIQHLRDNFFADEPLNKAAGLCGRDGKRVGNMELEQVSYETLEDNLSIMAVTEQDEIAGVFLNGVLHEGDVEACLKKIELSDDEEFKKIFRLLYSHNLKANVFQKFHVDRVLDLRILSVDARFRGRGIAKELVHQSELLAKRAQFKLMKADATGIFSQKILKSSGFEVLSELYYSKYTDAFGLPILNVDAPHIKLQLLYKQLQN